ncbi:hypothetical protein RM405_004120 [Enterobacter kobei]|uniref:hypothetical protein n=1 Tax=Enterobacter cloacae complex TaxID=354276 RepID=UPI001F438041|nr:MULTISPECIES: hypothetical protein [Enterobacter cloacae complex]ELE9693043.1 hypothetical protein [Enterobacter kobei]HAV1607849.1 hypothetical protein [Enterobacter hormaechei subsp. steigerwaltii]HDW3274216.1 hypothetical protein [Enterobacter asburiae]ELN9397946.1 hypothetical protein [Enterobacter kobei]MCF1189696.1 hypothetical protein [Enterobacter hormaechei]
MPELDEITKRLNKALDIVLLKYPQRTSFGILIGFILVVLLHTFRFALTAYGVFVDWMHYLFCEVAGVLVMNAKSVYEAFNGTALDERLGTLMNVIDARKDLSKAQRDLLIYEILKNEIDSLSANQVEQVGKKITDK